MRILQAVHYFPPKHIAGTEVYAANLSRELVKRSQVAVFTTEDGPNAVPEMKKREEDGLTIYEVSYSMPMSYAETFRHPAVSRLFEKALTDFKPEAVHFQHAIRIGADCILAAKRRKLPVVMTLADYWYMCPQTQLLIKQGPEGEDVRCWGPEGGMRCLSCPNASEHLYSINRDLPEAIPTQARSFLFRALHGMKKRVPAPLWRGMRNLYFKTRNASPSTDNPNRTTVDRLAFMKHALGQVDQLLAPSSFLAQRYIAEGFPKEKILVSDYGFADAKYYKKSYEFAEDDSIHFGYIGTLTHHKGVHTLIEAFNGIELPNAYLHIYGDLAVDPPYSRLLQKMATNPRIGFKGPILNEKVGDILGHLDIQVVPSLWWENSPLTIHEAFLAGVPPVVSGIGGMAGLVDDYVNGRHFKPGDADDLREVLESIVAEPSLIEKWAREAPEVKTIEEDAREMEKIYRRLIK